MKSPDTYVVEMTAEQWQFVVHALEYVHQRARVPAKPTQLGPIDLFSRATVRRRVSEVVTEIQSNVPSAEAALCE